MSAAFPPVHRERRARVAGLLLSVVLFALAMFALHRLLAEFSYAGFVAELEQTRGDRLVGATLAALCSYCC